MIYGVSSCRAQEEIDAWIFRDDPGARETYLKVCQMLVNEQRYRIPPTEAELLRLAGK